MKQPFYLFRRGRTFYVQDAANGRQESLRTSDRRQAERLLHARVEATTQPAINLALARTYLSAHDRRLVERTWSDVMKVMAAQGGESSQRRCRREMRGHLYQSLRQKRLFETTSEDFLAVLKKGGVYANRFLRRAQNMAMGLGWLAWPILAAKCWPRPKVKQKRGIHWEDISASSALRKHRTPIYYDLLWECGASQTDAAELEATNIDWENRLLIYRRKKLRSSGAPPVRLVIGPRLKASCANRPGGAPVSKNPSNPRQSSRSGFRRRCRILDLNGVSLHSYRYAWAERAKAAGYSERWAQAALGHNSRAVHEAYARGAEVNCPSLEEFEKKIIPLQRLHVDAYQSAK